MGLDMYLDRYPKAKSREDIEAESDALWKEGYEVWDNKFRAQYRVAYWRKVNFLHGWMTRTLAAGVDECQNIEVRKCNLESLLELVDKACSIIEGEKFVPQKDISKKEDWKPRFIYDPSKASVEAKWNDENKEFDNLEEDTEYFIVRSKWPELEKILPPEKGFFFGWYYYDRWYAWDMFMLRETLNSVLKEWDDDYRYIYHASW